MHIGSYDDEPATVAMMHEFMKQQGYELDITDKRLHHEIYLSDARKVAPEKLKTVIRHPIRKKGCLTVPNIHSILLVCFLYPKIGKTTII